MAEVAAGERENPIFRHLPPQRKKISSSISPPPSPPGNPLWRPFGAPVDNGCNLRVAKNFFSPSLSLSNPIEPDAKEMRRRGFLVLRTDHPRAKNCSKIHFSAAKGRRGKREHSFLSPPPPPQFCLARPFIL